ncbi:MFS transporter [Pseudonocardia sp. CA-142604]|uniref:MFS transporter n=1 Tax=Pseudonocardia sp. CA-142604 TaxID=3240024 RepID=UPI003D92C502
MTQPSGRWWVLVTAGLAQLVVVLDSTVVTIALPSAQQDLAMTDASRSWVVTAYALPFGGLLLLGGGLVARLGQRRAFVAGLAGFAIASMVAGSAPTAALLFAGRAGQGVSAALLAPAGLAIISTVFVEPRERSLAFGVFGALTGAGAAVGLLLGGLLTEALGWRSCLWINVPIVAAAVAGAWLVVPWSAGRAVRLDLLGTATSAIGMSAAVFGLTEVATRGWTDPLVQGSLVLGVIGLVAFGVAQLRVGAPLLPPHVVLDRTRGGAFLAIGLPQLAMFGFFLVLTYWFQEILGYRPLQAGLAFLPLALTIAIGSTVIAGGLGPRLPTRVLIPAGLLVMAAGTGLLIGLDPTDPALYLIRFLPAEALIGLGLGCALTAAVNACTHGLRPDDTAAAAAAVNAVQQLGGSVGTALLNTVAAVVTMRGLQRSPDFASSDRLVPATVAGFDAALVTAATILAATAVTVGLVIPRRPPADHHSAAARDEN